MQQLKIVIAGGSGFIGQGLTKMWYLNNDITILSRQIPGAKNNSFTNYQFPENVKFVKWDGETVGPWKDCLEGCDILVNLAGKSVNCIYNEANQQEVLESRVDSVNALGEAIKTLHRPPALWVQTASATIYRHAEDHSQDEYNGEIEDDFSVQVCKAWEAAVTAQELPQTRKVILRTAITLERGGVLVPFQRLIAAGLGGKQGSGRQMFSWLHLADFAGIVEWLHENPNAEGVYNAAAPGPVNNSTFMATLRQVLKMPLGISLPEWFIKIAVPVFCTEPELLLKSRWVLPTRLQAEGYVFRYPELHHALSDIYGEITPKAAKIVNTLKIIDLIVQPMAFVIPLILFQMDLGGIDRFLFFPYFTVGAVQVLSAVFNGLMLPSAIKADSRFYYSYQLLVTAILALIFWVLGTDALFHLGVVLIFTSIISAIWYYVITIREFHKVQDRLGL